MPSFAQTRAEPEVQQPMSPWRSVTLITMLGLAIRLTGLGSKSLWMDEAHSFYFASQSLRDIFSRLCDPHPPGYYALLHGVLAVGKTEFWLRLPSAIAAALTIPLLYALSRELSAAFNIPRLDRRSALIASLLLAVAPLHVWYAQDARMYAIVAALGLGCVLLALRVAQYGQAKDTLAYVLCATAALYVDQSALLPLLLGNLLWFKAWVGRPGQLERSRRWEIARWIGLQLIVGAAFWLWWSQALFRSRFNAGTFYQAAMAKLVLERVGLSASVADVQSAFAVAGVALLALAVAIYWLLVRLSGMRRFSPILAQAVVVLFVLVTLGSAVPRLFTLKRLLLSLLPYGMLISAWGVCKLQLKHWQISTLLAFSLVLCGTNIFWAPKDPWREAVAAVQEELGPDDILWVDELAVPAFDYYYGGSHERFVWRAAGLFDFFQDSDRHSAVSEGRLWFVAAADPYRNLLSYLPSSWEPVWSDDWHHVSVRAFAQPLGEPDPSGSDLELPTWLLTWPSPIHKACQDGD